MKRGLLGFPLLVLLTQVVSAQFFGGYGGFSLTDFFSRIDPSTITLSLLFLIFFALLFYATSRIFKDQYGQPNKGIAGTISFAVSFLIIYGIYRSGFNLEDLFYGLGIDSGVFYLIAFIIIIIGAIFLIKKVGFSWFLIIFGLLLILLVIFTDIFYEETFIVVIGLVLLILGIILLRKKRKKKVNNPAAPSNQPSINPADQQIAYQQRRQRSLYDLKQKYMAYLFQYNKRGQTANRRRKILRAMNIIISYAKRAGVSRREFLSSRIGGSNAKAPEELRPPFDG